MAGSRDLPTPLWDADTNRAIHDALPELVIDALAVITRLGDGATLVALAILFYWFGAETDWRKRGMLMAVAIATLSISAGLKGMLDVARPFVSDPTLLDEFAIEYDGLSTPSAHAMGSAAIYGGLATVMDVGKRWQRYTVAGFLIFTISLSRVTLGVHYVGDVLLGVVLGLALVWLGLRLIEASTRTLLPVFALSFVVALVANPLGSEEYVTMSIGASAGGLVAWWFIRERDPRPLAASIIVLGAFILPALLVFRVFEALVTVDIFVEIAGMEVPVMSGVRAAGYAIIFGFAMAVPVIAERFDDNEYTHRLQAALPLRGRLIDPEMVDEPDPRVADD